MDLALAFNIAMSLVAFLGGWLMKSLFERIKGLEDADKELSRQVGKLREELPSAYVRRDDFKESLDNMFALLRRIEDKLDKKVDKP
jgi:hypothetical protein